MTMSSDKVLAFDEGASKWFLDTVEELLDVQSDALRSQLHDLLADRVTAEVLEQVDTICDGQCYDAHSLVRDEFLKQFDGSECIVYEGVLEADDVHASNLVLKDDRGNVFTLWHAAPAGSRIRLLVQA
jgi:hypothetical protein